MAQRRYGWVKGQKADISDLFYAMARPNCIT